MRVVVVWPCRFVLRCRCRDRRGPTAGPPPAPATDSGTFSLFSFASNPESALRGTGTCRERLVVGVDAVPERHGVRRIEQAPATTRNSMSMTSSASRRPFGKPARSPPSTPRRFSVARRRGAEVDLERVNRLAGLCWFRPGTPWSRASTMSVRSVSLTPRLNSAFMSFASSGSTTNFPKFLASSAGCRAVEVVLLARAGSRPR